MNESRPNFLMKLFRDLQLISTDPLRHQIMLSIRQMVSNHLRDQASRSGDGTLAVSVANAFNVAASLTRAADEVRRLNENARNTSIKPSCLTGNGGASGGSGDGGRGFGGGGVGGGCGGVAGTRKADNTSRTPKPKNNESNPSKHKNVGRKKSS